MFEKSADNLIEWCHNIWSKQFVTYVEEIWFQEVFHYITNAFWDNVII